MVQIIPIFGRMFLIFNKRNAIKSMISIVMANDCIPKEANLSAIFPRALKSPSIMISGFMFLHFGDRLETARTLVAFPKSHITMRVSGVFNQFVSVKGKQQIIRI